MTIKDLEAFGDGWNRHDVDYLMTFMTDDCVFETSSGSEVCGTRYVGRERVREGFAKVFKAFPDVEFREARHFVAGDPRGAGGGFPAPAGDRPEGEGEGLRPVPVPPR